MNILAIDPSSQRVGWAYFMDGKVKEKGFICLSGNFNKKLLTLNKAFTEIINGRELDWVIIEDQFVCSINLKSGLVVSKFAGIIAGLLAFSQGEQIKIDFISVAEWKKNVVDNGSASKETIRSYYDEEDDDIASAIGIGEGWLAKDGI